MAWSQLGQPTKRTVPWPDATSVPGLLKMNRNVSLKYDPALWKQVEPHNAGEFVLLHSSGDAHALVIAEPIAVPLASVQDVALANAQAADPNAKVVFRDKRRVNGADLYFLKIEANVDTVPMVYCGDHYAVKTAQFRWWHTRQRPYCLGTRANSWIFSTDLWSRVAHP